MTRTFQAAVPMWFLAIGTACLWTPAPTMWMAVLLLGTALLVPPAVLLGSAVVTALKPLGVIAARPRGSA